MISVPCNAGMWCGKKRMVSLVVNSRGGELFCGKRVRTMPRTIRTRYRYRWNGSPIICFNQGGSERKIFSGVIPDLRVEVFYPVKCL